MDEAKKTLLLDDFGNFSAIEDKTLRWQAALLRSSYNSKSPEQFQADVKQFLDEGTVPSMNDELGFHLNCIKRKNAIPPGVTFEEHMANLQQLMEIHNVYPDAEDFTGDKIDFTHLIDLSRFNETSPEDNVFFQEQMAIKQEMANRMLKFYTEKYGYQPLFRKGIREFFETDLLSLQQTFFRPHPGGRRYAYHAQSLCSQAINESPWLSIAEKTVLIQASRCFPQDAEAFWRWTTQNRLSYLAMIAILQEHEQNMHEQTVE